MSYPIYLLRDSSSSESPRLFWHPLGFLLFCVVVDTRAARGLLLGCDSVLIPPPPPHLARFSLRDPNCVVGGGTRLAGATGRGTRLTGLLLRSSRPSFSGLAPPDESRRTISLATPTAAAANSGLFQMSGTAEITAPPHLPLMPNSSSELCKQIITDLELA